MLQIVATYCYKIALSLQSIKYYIMESIKSSPYEAIFLIEIGNELNENRYIKHLTK